ncbi:MAG: hypothetical protein H6R26_1449 [Proteobacteria bacterium]|nr:hypothetical protein [Pseudomonadota bacterium]
MSHSAFNNAIAYRRFDAIGGDCACILDLPLALSRYGLPFALRLADELNVWLMRTLWDILDNSEYFAVRPESLLFSQVVADGGPDSLAFTLSQWQAARTQTDLSGLNLYWAGDATHESLMPRGTDNQVIQRFETLAASLDEQLERRRSVQETSCWNPGTPLCDGARDAVALAGALTRFRPIIFTIHGKNASAPALCDYLNTCGIPCRRIEQEATFQQMQSALDKVFMRCGVTELLWAGLSLAAVHIVAPRTFVIPTRMPEEQFFEDGLAFTGHAGYDAEDWWADAVALWYPLCTPSWQRHEMPSMEARGMGGGSAGTERQSRRGERLG